MQSELDAPNPELRSILTTAVREIGTHSPESSRHAARAGMGLGLPLVRGLTKTHGGSAGVTSNPRGRGRFTARSIPVSAGDMLARVGAVVHLRLITLALAVSVLSASGATQGIPNRPDSLKFAVVGDFGTGSAEEYEVAARLFAMRGQFNFEMVVTTGDNIVGKQDEPSDFAEKFAIPFRRLLDSGVRFFASLGNHDRRTNAGYPPFNMNGARYYTFARSNTRFFILDSNMLDRVQIAWLEQTLRESSDEWKVCILHHPLYSGGARHGASLELRVILEPILVRYGVDVVFSGHDHVYERLRPQKGITYFVVGAGGQGIGRIEPTATTASSFDHDQSFMLVEVNGDEMHFQTVTRGGATVDSGVIGKAAQGLMTGRAP